MSQSWWWRCAATNQVEEPEKGEKWKDTEFYFMSVQWDGAKEGYVVVVSPQDVHKFHVSYEWS